MKTQKINIKNFKGIRSYEGDISGKHVYLVGGNEQGKTSFIDAVWLGLSGKNCPPTPITDNGNKGLIEIDLGDFIARTKLKKGRPISFELENKNWTEESERFIKSPRSYMESRVGILNFDINDFFNKTDAEQVKYFAKIMGEDFSDIDSQIEEISESRRFDKRKLKELEGQNDYYNDEDANREPIDIVELSKKIEAENEKKSTYEKVKSGVDQRVDRLAKIREELSILEKEALRLTSEKEDGEKWLEDKNNQFDEVSLKEMRKDLENSTKINDEIRISKELKVVDEKCVSMRKAIEDATNDIEVLRVKKAERISNKINIEGLEYNVAEERFLWNGLPFDRKQINTAAQLISGMKIGSTLLRDLKILKVDASLIDKENFDKVLEWADNEGIQLFVELVDREATKLEVVLQDPGEY